MPIFYETILCIQIYLFFQHSLIQFHQSAVSKSLIYFINSSLNFPKPSVPQSCFFTVRCICCVSARRPPESCTILCCISILFSISCSSIHSWLMMTIHFQMFCSSPTHSSSNLRRTCYSSTLTHACCACASSAVVFVSSAHCSACIMSVRIVATSTCRSFCSCCRLVLVRVMPSTFIAAPYSADVVHPCVSMTP